jgi:hypothetical protein
VADAFDDAALLFSLVSVNAGTAAAAASAAAAVWTLVVALCAGVAAAVVAADGGELFVAAVAVQDSVAAARTDARGGRTRKGGRFFATTTYSAVRTSSFGCGLADPLAVPIPKDVLVVGVVAMLAAAAPVAAVLRADDTRMPIGESATSGAKTRVDDIAAAAAVGGRVRPDLRPSSTTPS